MAIKKRETVLIDCPAQIKIRPRSFEFLCADTNESTGVYFEKETKKK